MININKNLKPIFLLTFVFFAYTKLFSQNTLVFFGSYNWDKSTDGIYVYELDTIKGKLTKKSAFSGVLNPSFLTLSPNGDYLFSCTESKTANAGSVSSFSVNPENGTLNYINSQKSGGENPVFVSVHKNGKWLINGNYTEGSISVFPIAENGTILPFVQNFHFQEGSIHKDRQDRSHIHSIVFSPEFDYIFAPDLGADKIRIFGFHEKEKEPLQPIEKPFVATNLGSGPRHFTFHPNGKFAYCIEELAGAVSVYHYENSDLEPIQWIVTHSEKYKERFESSDIHISPDGKFLYASNRGSENNIAIFAIQTDGKLRSIGYQSTFGKHPRTFAIDETGKFIIVTNTKTSDVFVFKRNSKTGLLKKMGRKTKIKNITSVQIKKY